MLRERTVQVIFYIFVLAPTMPQSPEAESEEDQAARVIQKGLKQLRED